MRPSVEKIIEVVADHFNVRPDDILASRREQPAAYVRQVAYWLARDLTLLSYPAIGREINRDHTTVRHGTQLIEVRREGDKVLQGDLDALTERLQSKPPTMADLVGDLHHVAAELMIEAIQDAVQISNGIWSPPQKHYGDHQFTIQLFNLTAFGEDAADACRNWLRAAQATLNAQAA